MRARTIAIIGGGPAGATAARTLAEGWGGGGGRVLVMEEKVGWEKPCGGGLTHKALRRYPFLAQAASGGNLLREAEFIASQGAVMRIRLRNPLAIYSRATLDQLLLDRARMTGAEIVSDRVQRLNRNSRGWEITCRHKTYTADFVILAAGARSRLRSVFARDFSPRDFMLTFGYYLPGEGERLRVKFYENFEGYAWEFPRPGHVSVGICGKVGEDDMGGLRRRLGAFIGSLGYNPDPRHVFSHLLPALSKESWADLRLVGADWGLVGDAAGLVDPLTGEGIYYAMRSGELLAEALLEGLPAIYPERVRNEFGRALALGARLAPTFYHGEFLGGGVTTRMIEFGTHSGKILELMQDLLEGSQSYPGLVARVGAGLGRALPAMGMGWLRASFQAGLSAAPPSHG